MIKIFSKHKIHIIFISLLSLNYFLPLLIFGKITLFYHDTLDAEIVYNSVLGRIFNGDFSSIKLFLNGEIKIEYLRRLFHPLSLFYYFFNPELAYWLLDILVKITSYFSLYILVKKINGDSFVSSLVACLFACINAKFQNALGMAIMPYIIYLISYKEIFKLKHFLIVIFFGLNTDFSTCIPQIPAIIVAAYILNTNNNNKFIINLLTIISIFIFFIIISNSNLIYGQLKYNDSHRLSFFYESLPVLENIFLYLKSIVRVPSNIDWTLVNNFPEFIIFSSILIITVLKKERKTLKILTLILAVNFTLFVAHTETISGLRNSSTGLFKAFHFEYITWVVPLLYLIILSFLLHRDTLIKRYLKVLCLLSIIFFQINSSIVPFGKKYLLSEDKYRNIYTFDGYYMFDDYSKIKTLVKDSRVLSLGYDPMIAVMNNIYTIDGYHNVYPLSYKLKFRKLIEEELDKDMGLKKYYDNWGNRVYAFISDPNNIQVKFLEAKKLGASFVISQYQISSQQLSLVTDNFNDKIYLYKIN